MRAFYESFATKNVGQYKDFVHALLAAQGRPVLWHCTSGKDRTGFAAAILLRILGVQQNIVIEDYLLSQQYVDRNRRLIFLLWLTRGREVASNIQKFFLVREEWIQAAFQSIDEGWGNLENFSHEALDLSKEQIDQLRHFYLVSNNPS